MIENTCFGSVTSLESLRSPSQDDLFITVRYDSITLFIIVPIVAEARDIREHYDMCNPGVQPINIKEIALSFNYLRKEASTVINHRTENDNSVYI